MPRYLLNTVLLSACLAFTAHAAAGNRDGVITGAIAGAVIGGVLAAHLGNDRPSYSAPPHHAHRPPPHYHRPPAHHYRPAPPPRHHHGHRRDHHRHHAHCGHYSAPRRW